jgi:hypothetical protein
MGKPSGSNVVLGRDTPCWRGARFLKCAAALAVTGGALVFTGTAVSGAPTTPAGNTQSQSVPKFSVPAGLTIGAVVPPTPLLTTTPTVLPSPVNTYTVTTTADPSSGTSCPATAGHPCSLRAAMDQANTDGTFDKISLPSGTYKLELGDLAADNFAGTTIAGAGAGSTTIEADSTSIGYYPFSVFDVEGLLTISNATVSDGDSGSGGGIDLEEGSLALNGSTVTNNAAEGGGGIFVAPGTQATLSHSTVTGNEAVYGGGIDDEGEVLASNSSVTNNLAEEDGGGVVIGEDVAGAGFNGSALTVSGNYAPSFGGGIDNPFGGTLQLSNSTVSNNGTYLSTATENGGGIATEGVATLNNSTVTHNTAALDGAGIINAGELSVTGGKITHNGPPVGDHLLSGGGLLDVYQATLTNVSVLDNQADSGAGAFAFTEEPPATLVVKGGLVSDNGSMSTQVGGGLFAVGATLNVTGTSMTGDSGGDGGAIGAVEGSIVTLTNDTIGSWGDPNYAVEGGGVDLYEGAAALITGSTITYSNAGDSGGGIDAYEGAAVTVQNSLVADNQADYGGGIDIDETLGTITGSTIASNQALDYGGGIENVEDSLSMTNDTVANNRVGQVINDGYGAGLDVDDNASVNLINVTVADNTAYGSGSAGGGIDVAGGGFVQTKGTLLAYNDDNGATKDNCFVVAAGILSSGYNLSSDTTCGFGGPGDLNNLNPNLGALANNGGPTPTEAVPSSSKAVEAEANCPPPTTDQRGVKRSKPCTIGAYQK